MSINITKACRDLDQLLSVAQIAVDYYFKNAIKKGLKIFLLLKHIVLRKDKITYMHKVELDQDKL